MAIINKLTNMATITYDGTPVNSNPVETLLELAPTIVKAVDKLTASLGDTLTYTITITNISLTAVNNLPFSDILPNGSTYVAGSFTVNSSSVTPTITGNTISYTIPTIAGLGVTTIVFQADVVGGVE